MKLLCKRFNVPEPYTQANAPEEPPASRPLLMIPDSVLGLTRKTPASTATQSEQGLGSTKPSGNATDAVDNQPARPHDGIFRAIFNSVELVSSEEDDQGGEATPRDVDVSGKEPRYDDDTDKDKDKDDDGRLSKRYSCEHKQRKRKYKKYKKAKKKKAKKAKKATD